MKRTNLITGKVETGKTKGIMFPEVEKLIKEEKNFFILDNKQEYYPRFKQELEEKGYQVWLINMRNPLKTNTINLLEYPYQLYKEGKKEKAMTLITRIAEEICIDLNNENERFWENSAADYLASLLLILLEKGTKEEVHFMSLGNLIHLIEDPVQIETLRAYFKTLEVTNPIYKLGSATLFSPIETRGGIISTLKYKLNLFFNREEILETVSTSEITMDLNTQKTAIFFIGKTELNAIANIVLDQLIMRNEESQRDLVCIFDTINSLPRIKGINEWIEYAALNNVQSYFITNCLEEVESIYGIYTFKKVAHILDTKDLEPIDIVDDNRNTVEYPTKKKSTLKTIDPSVIL